MPLAAAPGVAKSRPAAPGPRAGLVRDFAACMAVLGPFEPAPRLGVGVSGGADSTALALLADEWARTRGGMIVALIVDHGIRPQSASEARTVLTRMARHGIAGAILTLTGLTAGSGLQARARDARHAALRAACRARGILHLLLGHHAGDQSETVALRFAGGSGEAGLAAMAALSETSELRVLRPLLALPPHRLRDFLGLSGEPWLEDPSNANPMFTRARLRRDLTKAARARLSARADRAGADRQAAATTLAQELAALVTFSPLGFALVAAARLSPAALAAVIRTVAMHNHDPPLAAVARLAPALCSCSLAGVRLAPAGRWQPGGWIVVREQAPPPVPARIDARWGGFILEATHLPSGLSIGPRGQSSRRERAGLGVPDMAMRHLPTLWRDGRLAEDVMAYFRFAPPCPAAAAPFVPRGTEKLRLCAVEGDA